MDVLPISIYGDKILRVKAKPVEKVDDEIISLIQNMFATMRYANGIGLAANQVDIDKQIFVMDLSPVEGFEKEKPLVMINPEIILESDKTVVMEEGCLSLPNLKADVERPELIKVKYLDTDEEEREIEIEDLVSRVIQHEYDHLIGKMIPDRVDSVSRKRMKKELLRIMKRQVDIDYLVTTGKTG